MHAFISSTWEAEAQGISEFKASLVYTANSRPSTATQREPCLLGERKKKRKGSCINCCRFYRLLFLTEDSKLRSKQEASLKQAENSPASFLLQFCAF